MRSPAFPATSLPLLVHCPFCQGLLANEGSLAGQLAVCPNCRNTLRLPGGVEAPLAQAVDPAVLPLLLPAVIRMPLPYRAPLAPSPRSVNPGAGSSGAAYAHSAIDSSGSGFYTAPVSRSWESAPDSETPPVNCWRPISVPPNSGSQASPTPENRGGNHPASFMSTGGPEVVGANGASFPATPPSIPQTSTENLAKPAIGASHLRPQAAHSSNGLPDGTLNLMGSGPPKPSERAGNEG